MKKILFINPHFPLFTTPTCGGANRSQMFLRALTKVGHVDVVSFFEDEKSDLENCDVIYSGRPNFCPTESFGRIEKFVRLLDPWNANNIFPLNKSVETFCDGFIVQGDYDYIAVRYLFTVAEYGLLKYASRLIIDVDDNPRNTLLVRMRKMRTVPKKLYCMLASCSAFLMSRIVLRKTYCSFFSNPSQSPSKHSVFLHNVSVLNEILPPVFDDTPLRVLVVGSWSYFPNRHGLLRFLEKIWPNTLKSVPKAELRVVGRMDDDFYKLCNKEEGVVAVGYVGDLLSEYREARCVVVPIYYGSGTCIKVVETMCVNRPFVSTPCGVRGLENYISAGEDYLLSDNDKVFSEHLIFLLQNPSYGAYLAKHALKCVAEFFSVDSFNEIVRNNICKQ